MVRNTQVEMLHSLTLSTPCSHRNVSCLGSVEGVGEDSVEDKPYCDVAMEEVIPAVKTLIRAVR